MSKSESEAIVSLIIMSFIFWLIPAIFFYVALKDEIVLGRKWDVIELPCPEGQGFLRTTN